MRSARALLTLAAVAVTLLFAYLAVRDVALDELREAFARADAAWLAPAVVVLAVSILLRALRWRALFAPATRPPVGPVLRATLIGYFFNNILPARAGELARVLALGRAGVSRAEATGTVLIERLFDVLGLLVLLFVMTPWLPDVPWLDAAAALALGLAALLAALVVVLAHWGERPLLLLARPLRRLPLVGTARVDAAVENLGAGLAGLRRPGVAIAAFALTLASWAVMAVSVWLVMPAFDLGLSPVAAVVVLAALGLAAILPSSPAALGVFEGVTVLALGAYDVGDARALSYALVLHAVHFFPFIVAGAVALRLGRSR